MAKITEKLLKDSFHRKVDMSSEITEVKIDLRSDTHDVLQVYIRGTIAGQLVTDKFDSVTIARRLIPDSLRYDKEPSSITKNAEDLAGVYFNLLMEVRSAIRTGSTDPLRAFMRKLDDDNSIMPGDSYVFLPDREVGVQAKGAKPSLASPS